LSRGRVAARVWIKGRGKEAASLEECRVVVNAAYGRVAEKDEPLKIPRREVAKAKVRVTLEPESAIESRFAKDNATSGAQLRDMCQPVLDESLGNTTPPPVRKHRDRAKAEPSRAFGVDGDRREDDVSHDRICFFGDE
jgi:hypothetical protein